MHPFLLSMEWRVTPLYTHWRHRPVSSVGGGCIPETRPLSSSPTEGINDHAVFCKFNPRFEALLQEYHAHLRSGNKKYQSEIDRYLVACSSQRFQHLVLPRGRVPHYDNLPDLSFYTIAIIDGSRDHIPYLQQIFLLLRQCTPLRRRTKRAHRELQWEEHSMQGIQHLVQTMQGTLLGLYPTCARAVAFVTRIHVYRFVRSLLVLDFGGINVFLQRMRYIIKICVMEHLCNTITDYHPGICHMLNKSGQQLQHFCHAVTTMCDIFRGELNAAFAKCGCIVGALLQLEKSAHSFFERCTRAYRGIITNQSQCLSSLEILRKKGLTPSMDFIHLLQRVHSTQNQYIFDLVHKDKVPREHLETLWHLLQCITVCALPLTIREKQYIALTRRYPQVLLLLAYCFVTFCFLLLAYCFRFVAVSLLLSVCCFRFELQASELQAF